MHQSINPESKSHDKIQSKVLSRLGRPSDLSMVDVKNVYANKWRVNVWCEKPPVDDASDVVRSIEIRHSFFCTMTEGGTLRCKPKIEKLYRQTGKQQ